jgi:hypothetical protein
MFGIGRTASPSLRGTRPADTKHQRIGQPGRRPQPQLAGSAFGGRSPGRTSREHGNRHGWSWRRAADPAISWKPAASIPFFRSPGPAHLVRHLPGQRQMLDHGRTDTGAGDVHAVAPSRYCPPISI